LLGRAGDTAYEISVEMELVGTAIGGLLLFYSDRLYCGMGHDGEHVRTFRSGAPLSYWQEPPAKARRMELRIVNDRHIVTQFYRADGGDWRRHGLRMETSGYNTNTADDLLSLRPALFATGAGEVRYRRFRYRAL
jgi:xylan 1,4-beta-xylosidase